MSEEFYALAKARDIEGLCEAVVGVCAEEDPAEDVFQWMLVAAALGSEEAEEMVDDLYEDLDSGGTETIAVLHYQVAEWFISGNHGVAVNMDHGLEQLANAERFQLRASVDLDDDLKALRETVGAAKYPRFDEIFPGLVAS